MTPVLEEQSLANASHLASSPWLAGASWRPKRLDMGHFWPWDECQGENWRKVWASTLLMRGSRLLENDSSNMGDKAFHPVSLPHLSRDPNLTSPNNLLPIPEPCIESRAKLDVPLAFPTCGHRLHFCFWPGCLSPRGPLAQERLVTKPATPLGTCARLPSPGPVTADTGAA